MGVCDAEAAPLPWSVRILTAYRSNSGQIEPTSYIYLSYFRPLAPNPFVVKGFLNNLEGLPFLLHWAGTEALEVFRHL